MDFRALEKSGQHKLVDRLLLSASIDNLFAAATPEEMNAMLNSLSREDANTLLAKLKQINDAGYTGQRLYHGSPNHDIKQLSRQRGQRSLGFLGATYNVDNKGVFLTDTADIAHHFGSNRADSNNYRVYEAYGNTDKVLDASDVRKIPVELRRLGAQLVNKYHGGNKRDIAYGDIWWLLDQDEFVEAIKAMGYDGVKFREGKGRYGPSVSSLTYFMFNPEGLKIKDPANDTVRTRNDLWNHIQGLRAGEQQ